ncbi:chemokine XC receptor 1-like [Cheilinus undulatus]|uniref:chemokine XC receptor 1-like n=1 Tax=Cheilinus undulatus TaxID=241271 RepID=UPI001BD2D499|nr:chemokine XC receptor 1-like [Cheilinus undulatus]
MDMMGDVNDTGNEGFFCDETFDFNTLSGAFFIFIFILSLIGNILLLCVLVVHENLKNVTNLFILNLACSDLIFTITLPFWAVYHLHHWVFGDFACKFETAAYYAGTYSSVILMTAMTVDRFLGVVLHSRPINPLTRQRCAIVSCVAAWVISIAASVRDAFRAKVLDTWNNETACELFEHDVSLGYYLQMSLLFIFPFAIIVFCYAAILRTVLQASNRKTCRTVVVVLCIVAAFFICWGPYNIILLIASFYEPAGCNATEVFYMAYDICRILAFSHCCMNPLLCMLSQKLRRDLLQLLHCNKTSKYVPERSNGQSTSVIQNVAYTAKSSAIMLDAPSK